MKSNIKMTLTQWLKQPLCSTTFGALALLVLSACSGGGAEIEENETQSVIPPSNYAGPAPETDDVQAFKINVWDNLSTQSRCGQCHGAGQAPEFVNLEDINVAYAQANTIVDLSSPKDSRMVTKVGGGHNCWLSSDSACADTITSYITAWAGDTAGSANAITLEEPPIRDPGDSKTFPDAPDLFSTTVYPILAANCSNCHSDTAANPIAPFFASSDLNTAYEAAKSKIDLDTPANSRFVVRLNSEFHNCWSDCAANATEMETAITSFSDQIEPTEVDPLLLKSKALFLTDGIVASGGGRYDASAIAVWNFKTGTGDTAFDTSGVEPAINLELSGNYTWVGGWGIQIVDGKAQGTTDASRKLHSLITSTGEYSIEAWVVPANVTQEGPAGIVSYSAGTTARNFTLGQTLYNYNFLNRSSETDENGEAALSTADAEEILQTSLQHVIATFSPTEGRKIFVNGTLVSSEDVETGGTLSDWNDTYAFVLGNEVSSDRLFAGTFRMVAIHNRALTQEQVVQNFDVGVGEKFFMLFSISHLVDLADSFIMYEVSQYDSYSYLFAEPTFVNLNGDAVPDNIDIEKFRVAINGKEATTGQAYKNVIANVNGDQYSSETGQLLSRLGTVINLEKGPQADEFFITFEKINGAVNAFVEPVFTDTSTPVDLEPRPEIGVRDFAEINATMSQATGISMANPDVMGTYQAVKQQLPTLTDIDIFVSSQQMGITQLAIEYCNALVEDTSARADYFVGFNFGDSASVAFDSDTKRNIIFDALIANTVGNNLATQPSDNDIKTELNSLTDKLTACGNSCAADRTETVVKAVCAATIANAAMLVQ
jgi:mono/diheme cytochrome c family protein